ncbi:MAG: N-acetyltransferase [Candidatus Omnitrophica bacterium]|nr:N-acetyltransferase [Candidatus Omnitrophota bacterium]MDD5440780.1 N-acetyltransferase [Candidatus Omnitrophota bacterium]
MIRKAVISDSVSIHELITFWAKKRKVLPRPLNYVYENIRDFWVYIDNKRIVACCALHIVGWDDLAEVKSLCVMQEYLKKGYGKKLVTRCYSEAKSLGIKKVFALTFVPKFFLRIGFSEIERNSLPHKIWSECVNCVYFPDCKEHAVLKDIK